MVTILKCLKVYKMEKELNFIHFEKIGMDRWLFINIVLKIVLSLIHIMIILHLEFFKG